MQSRLLIAFAAVFVLTGCRQSPTVSSPTPNQSPDAGSPTPNQSPRTICVASSADEISYQLNDFSFTPPCASGTGTMGLSINNVGPSLHNFSVEGFPGIDLDIPPGGENNTEATGLPPGNHVVFCKYHRDTNNMRGMLVIR